MVEIMNDMKLENAEILYQGNNMELRLSFTNGRQHSVMLSNRHPASDAANMLRYLAANIYDDPQLVTPPNVIAGDDMSMAEVIARAYEERLTGRELDGMGIKSLTWEDDPQYSTLVLDEDHWEPVLWYTNDDDGVHCLPEYKNMIAAAPDMWAIIKQLIDTKQITDDQWSAMDKIAARIDR